MSQRVCRAPSSAGVLFLSGAGAAIPLTFGIKDPPLWPEGPAQSLRRQVPMVSTATLSAGPECAHGAARQERDDGRGRHSVGGRASAPRDDDLSVPARSVGALLVSVRDETACGWCGMAIVRFRRPGSSKPRQLYCGATHATNARRARQKARLQAPGPDGSLLPAAVQHRQAKEQAIAARLRAAADRAAQACLREQWTIEEAHAAAIALAEEQRLIRCPRPDKLAWGTAEGATRVLAAMRGRPGFDATAQVYRCACNTYHVGRPGFGELTTLNSITVDMSRECHHPRRRAGGQRGGPRA